MDFDKVVRARILEAWDQYQLYISISRIFMGKFAIIQKHGGITNERSIQTIIRTIHFS